MAGSAGISHLGKPRYRYVVRRMPLGDRISPVGKPKENRGRLRRMGERLECLEGDTVALHLLRKVLVVHPGEAGGFGQLPVGAAQGVELPLPEVPDPEQRPGISASPAYSPARRLVAERTYTRTA
jgi:hypothetical protein